MKNVFVVLFYFYYTKHKFKIDNVVKSALYYRKECFNYFIKLKFLNVQIFIIRLNFLGYNISF